MLAPRNLVFRDKGIVKIQDQMGYSNILLKNFKGQPRTRHMEYIAHNFLSANRKSFEALDIESSVNIFRDALAVSLKTNGIVGAVPLYSSENRKITGGLIVEPKFGWNDIGPLLHCIGWAASPQLLSLPMIPGSAKEIPPWVLAGPIIERLAQLLMTINKSFSMEMDFRETPRGTILWNKYFSQSIVTGKYQKIPCKFPDLNQNNVLRSYIKWGLEKVKISLLGSGSSDLTSHELINRIETLLTKLRDISSKMPTRNLLDGMLQNNQLSTNIFSFGVEAISWILDERGLAGQSEPDGLSWKLVMSDLFEKWVEAIVRAWAHQFGGKVTTSRQSTSRKTIYWDLQNIRGISSLVPDIVVETDESIYIFDAKYKKLFEDLDDEKYRELSKDIQEEHRHDVHQIIAYSSLFTKKRIVSTLVYPLSGNTYKSLVNRGRILNRAYIPVTNRLLELGIFGIPLSVNDKNGMKQISVELSPLRRPLLS